jgi:FKBP-type peptidyl-prolyl cis-trans isomerase 2
MASVRYEYDTPDKKIVFKSAAPGNIRIGSGELLRGAERGLIGMKPGGERNVTMAPSLAFATAKMPASPDIKEQLITAKLSLLKLWPDAPVSPMPLRIIDTRFGNGPRAECGDTVTANITIWKLDGTKLFSTQGFAPATFAIGASDMPYGIEQAATGMTEGSERTVIMPPAFTHTLVLKPARKPPLSGLMQSNEIVLVEMTRLPAVEKSAAIPDKK